MSYVQREDLQLTRDLGISNLRPVAEAYRKLIRQWSFIPLLPNGLLTWIQHWDDQPGESAG